LLQPSVEKMVKLSQEWTIKNEKELKGLIDAYVGKRYQKKVMERFAREEGNTLWSLTNAITWVASHDTELKDTSRETLLDKAGDVLMIPTCVGL